jgi:serine/threonine-protein kinase RsbT
LSELRGTHNSIHYCVPLFHESDIAVVRGYVRELGRVQQLLPVAIEALATAVTEVARNVLVHAGGGEIWIDALFEGGRKGVRAIARDTGAGIRDLDAAMRDGFSTGTGLGAGLPGARRLVDEFALTSKVGEGTTVTLKQWNPAPRSHP